MLNTQREIIDALPQTYVWDPFVRVGHWVLTVGFAVAYLVVDPISVHVWAGALVGVMVAARVVWGFIGSEHARFGDFLYAPTTVFRYVRDLLRFRAQGSYVGHSPGGGYVIVTMIGLLAATALTGVLGPSAWHGALADVTLAVIFVHIAGVVLRSVVYGQNLIRAQFTGYKRL